MPQRTIDHRHVCAHCGQEFLSKKKVRKFCSLRCANTYAAQHRERLAVERRVSGKFLAGDGCWPWVGSLDGRGYGRVNSGGRGTPLQAHRVVYEWLMGPIPEGLELDHLCRNRACVRPDHLEPVTHKINVGRAWAARRGG